VITIVNITEQAIQSELNGVLHPHGMPVFISDATGENDDVKPPMPYVVVHGAGYEELAGPGTGLFKVRIRVTFRSHVKEDEPQFRDSIIALINNFAYSEPASVLSETSGYHCYGFAPVSGSMEVNTDLKCYEYLTEWDLWCMPRDNS
jgi:hypothetical protein